MQVVSGLEFWGGSGAVWEAEPFYLSHPDTPDSRRDHEPLASLSAELGESLARRAACPVKRVAPFGALPVDQLMVASQENSALEPTLAPLARLSARAVSLTTMETRLAAVIFDVGGVLLDVGEPVARVAWQRRLQLGDGQLEEILWKAIGSRGVAERDKVIEGLAVATGLSGSGATQLLEDSIAHWSPVREVLRLLPQFRDVCSIGILSNCGAAARFGFEWVLGLHELSDVMILSAEVGMEKPAPTIYRLTAERLGVEPAACLFIDDLLENITGARAVGMRTLHHVSVARTVAELETLLAHG